MAKNRFFEVTVALALLAGCSGAEPMDEAELGSIQEEINKTSGYLYRTSNVCQLDEYLAGVDWANTNRILCARTNQFNPSATPYWQAAINGVASCGINALAVGWTKNAAGTAVNSIRCRQTSAQVSHYNTLAANTTLNTQLSGTAPDTTSTSHLLYYLSFTNPGGWADELPICANRHSDGTRLTAAETPTNGSEPLFGVPGAIIELSRKTIQGVNKFFYTCAL